MSSLKRTIARQMARDGYREALRYSRLKCPKCGKTLVRAGISARKVTCPACGKFTGKLK